jgi:hypothetical protein
VPRLVGDHPEQHRQPAGASGVPAVDAQDRRQQVEQVGRPGPVGLDDAAHHPGRRPATVQPQHRVVVREVLLGQQVGPAGDRRVRAAAQQVPPAVRHQRQVPGPQHGPHAVDLQHAAALGDEVEAHAAVEGGHRHAPGSGGLRPAVEDAPDPQVGEHAADRVDRRPRPVGRRLGNHVPTLAGRAPDVQAVRTNGHGLRTRGHGPRGRGSPVSEVPVSGPALPKGAGT